MIFKALIAVTLALAGAVTFLVGAGQVRRDLPRTACEQRTFVDSRPLLSHCATVTGRVVYVEREDPDGDGDAHLVVLGGYHVTIVKIVKEDKSRGLPRLGDRVTYTGPMVRNSQGFALIHGWARG